jgi:hypothetical protein
MGAVMQKRGFVVLVEVIYLLGLFTVAIYYIASPNSWLHIVLPSAPGWLPAGVPWFGALGAVIISLSGTFDHRTDWDASWNLWHFCRPLIGISLAIISWLIFQAGILAVGSAPNQQVTPGSAGVVAPTNLLFYLIAFIVGYREQVFRELIKRVADVILSPGSDNGTTGTSPVINNLAPATGRAAGGDTVTITGTGLSGTTGVSFGANAAASMQINSDGQITVITPPGAPGAVKVTVTTNGGSAARDFTYQA